MNTLPYNTGDLIGGSIPGGTFINMGLLAGYSVLDKFGINPLITPTSDPEEIWEFGGAYPYDTGADIISISSSSAADTQVIKVQGLDADGYAVTQDITLQGQTRVALDTPLWRVFRMENEADIGGDLAGTVYCYTGTGNTLGVPPDANVRAIIVNGNNQTLMTLYTIPKGKVGFIFRGEVGIAVPAAGPPASPQFARCRYESRRYGKVFKVKKELDLMSHGSSNYIDYRSFPDLVPELTDIRFRVQEVSDDMGVWGTLDILLVDIEQLPGNLKRVLGY